MPDAMERVLIGALTGGSCDVGQIRIESSGAGYALFHREDAGRSDLRIHALAEDAIAIARFDDAGKYRALKTAPNLAHGWRIQLAAIDELRCALDFFYPGRLAAFAAYGSSRLELTSLRETLARQTGMYRVAAKISDGQVEQVVEKVCRPADGCLRTILWKRDDSGEKPSSKLPPEKFDPQHDQAVASGCAALPAAVARVPLLCQEACTLLVGECRKAVQSAGDVSPL